MMVKDIMHRDVVTAAPEVTVRELAFLLSDEGISGVPVVSPSGEVLGVVSSTDVVRTAAHSSEVEVGGGRWVAIPPPEGTVDPEDEVLDSFSDYFLPEDSPTFGAEWAPEAESTLDTLTVSDIMTPVTFSVNPDTSLKDLADFLVRGRIHRALVLEDGRLAGIVTSMDVLRALAEGKI
jgi:CBS domain-containing protein